MWGLRLVMMTAVLMVSTVESGDIYQYTSFIKTGTNTVISGLSAYLNQPVNGISECSLLCSALDICTAFSFTPGSSEKLCKLTVLASPSTAGLVGSDIFVKVMIQPTTNVVETTTNIPTTTVTTMSPVADCTDPATTANYYNCQVGTPIFSVTALIRLFNNEALVISYANVYYSCPQITKISAENAKYCSGPHDIPSDVGLDSISRFIGGPPEAAVEHLGLTEATTRYFLFQGNTVYCYEHYAFNTARMRPCTSGWTSRSIQAQFGIGIPPEIDDVIGDANTGNTLYFLKGNRVYQSDKVSGVWSMNLTSPQHVHTVFPNMMCNLTAAMVGTNPGEMLFARESDLYVDLGAGIKHKKEFCHMP